MLIKIEKTARNLKRQIIKTQGEAEYAQLMKEFNFQLEQYKTDAKTAAMVLVNSTKDPKTFQLALCWLDDNGIQGTSWLSRRDISIEKFMTGGFFETLT